MTIDMTVSFLRPSVGKIAVEGTILKPGKTINYCEAIVLNEAGEITAKSSGTFMLRKSSAS
jgi:acyl-coenzyme A thioesterase PaaI-like protein